MHYLGHNAMADEVGGAGPLGSCRSGAMGVPMGGVSVDVKMTFMLSLHLLVPVHLLHGVRPLVVARHEGVDHHRPDR